MLGEDVLEKVFEVLKALKTALPSENMAQRLEDYIFDLKKEREKKQKEGLLERREDICTRRAVTCLENYAKLLKQHSDRQGEEAFEILRKAFGEERTSWEDEWDQAGNTLEYAFDFMEAAFYNSQEMVMFVSGINTDFYCVRFLETYECERYIRYNRDLLFEDVSRQIQRRIEEL